MLNNSLSHASKIGRNKKVLKVGKISAKDDILTFQEKQAAHIGNNPKISLGITPCQIEVKAQRLKAVKIGIRKRI